MLKRNYITLLFIGVLSSFVGISCIKEDLGDCPIMLRVGVRVLDSNGQDVTSQGQVLDGTMYVFDEHGQKVDEYPFSRDSIISRATRLVHYFGPKKLQFVFYGNQTSAMKSELGRIDRIGDLKFKLESNNRVAKNVPDLFYGTILHNVTYGDVEHTQQIIVDIHRIVSMVHVEVIGYRDWIESSLNKRIDNINNKLLRLGETPDTYIGLGQLGGDKVNYQPSFELNQKGNLLTQKDCIYPTDNYSPLCLQLMAEGQLLYSADQSSDGKKFVPEVDKTLNIIIRMGTSLSVKVVVTPWNVVYQEVEY